MPNIDRHYKVMRWLLLNNPRLKFVKNDPVYLRIVVKTKDICDEYCIEIEDLLEDLSLRYLQSGGAEKFDPAKANLYTWMKQWLDKELNNYRRKLHSKERRVITKLVRMSDLTNDEEEFNTEYVNFFVDPVTPEDLVGNAQTMEKLRSKFSEAELGFLSGELSPQEAIKLSGLSTNTFKKYLAEKLSVAKRLLNE